MLSPRFHSACAPREQSLIPWLQRAARAFPNSTRPTETLIPSHFLAPSALSRMPCAPVPWAKTASRRAPAARPSSWSASQLPRPWGQSSRGRILRVSWLAHMLPTLRRSVCSPNPIVSTVASRTSTRCAPKSLSRSCARTSSLIQSRSPRRECTARTPSCSC